MSSFLTGAAEFFPLNLSWAHVSDDQRYQIDHCLGCLYGGGASLTWVCNYLCISPGFPLQMFFFSLIKQAKPQHLISRKPRLTSVGLQISTLHDQLKWTDRCLQSILYTECARIHMMYYLSMVDAFVSLINLAYQNAIQYWYDWRALKQWQGICLPLPIHLFLVFAWIIKDLGTGVWPKNLIWNYLCPASILFSPLWRKSCEILSLGLWF